MRFLSSSTIRRMSAARCSDMVLSTTNDLPGYKITKVCGLVTGSTVRGQDVAKDLFSFAKKIIGGELNHYTQLLIECRQEALDRMREQAHKQGANAVIAMRLSTSSVADLTSEIVAYGTAVVVEPV